MKYLIFSFLPLFSFYPFQNELKLNGKYNMKYEEKYNFQNCVIIFNDSTYVRTLSSGKSISGHIFYQKFNVSLKDNESNLQMDFLKREIQKDTIFFSTKNLNDKANNHGLIVNSGKLIKIK